MFVILGAGVSGLTIATLLAEKGYHVTLVEQNSYVGGLAATLKIFDTPVDIGSHRIHPKYHSDALEFIKELIGTDLIRQKRNGRILIKGKYINYPPNIFSLLKAFGIQNCFNWGIDLILSRIFSLFKKESDNFEDFTISKVGSGLYKNFYKPYAIKLWGIDAKEISIDPAQQRIRRMNFFNSCKNFFINFFDKNSGYYFYPKHGIGQIAEKLKLKFLSAGGELLLEHKVKKFEIEDGKIKKIIIEDVYNKEIVILADKVITTLPLKINRKIFTNHGSCKLKYRNLRIVFLKINENSLTQNETHYIPSNEYKIGRISDIGKYSNRNNKHRVLTAEIPCSEGDQIWNADLPDLLALCKEELFKLNIISSTDCIEEIETIKVPDVYPVYSKNWNKEFMEENSHLNKIENLFAVGRSALFLHCNIDHCIYMSQQLFKHLISNKPIENWTRLQKKFFTFYIRE